MWLGPIMWLMRTMVFHKAWLLRRMLLPSALCVVPVCRRKRALVRRVSTWLVPIALGVFLRGSWLHLPRWHWVVLDMCLVWDWMHPTAPPSLAVGPALGNAADLAVGASAYRILWSPESRQLAVRWEEHEIWRSVAGAPFVATAGGSSMVGESHGNFHIRDRIRWQCKAQRVDAVFESAPSAAAEEEASVVVRGGFEDGSPACDGLQWALSFTLAGRQLRFALRVDGPPSAEAPNRIQLVQDLGTGAARDGAPSPTGGAQSELAVWGLGVQYRHYNMYGHCVPVWVSEQGIGRGAPSTQPLTAFLNAFGSMAGGNDYTTYSASASYVSSAGLGVVLEGPELALFDVASAGCSYAGLLSGGRFGSTGRVGGARRAGAAAASGSEASASAASIASSVGGVAISVHASSMAGRIVAAVVAALPSDGGARDPPATADGPPPPPPAAVASASDGSERGGFVAVSEGLQAIRSLTEYTGRQAELPPWADDGVIVGVQGGTSAVRAVVSALSAAGVPLVAVWLQDWVGTRDTRWGSRLWWNWM